MPADTTQTTTPTTSPAAAGGAEAPIARPAGAAAPGRVEPSLWIVVQPDGEPAYTSARATHDEAMQACFGNRWNTRHPRDWWQHNLDAGWTCREIALSSGAAVAGAGAVPTSDVHEVYRLRALMLDAHRKMVRFGWTLDGSDASISTMLDLEAKHRQRWHDFARYLGIPLDDEDAAPSPEPRPAEGTAAGPGLGEVDDEDEGIPVIHGMDLPTAVRFLMQACIRSELNNGGMTFTPRMRLAYSACEQALRTSPGAAADAVPEELRRLAVQATAGEWLQTPVGARTRNGPYVLLNGGDGRAVPIANMAFAISAANFVRDLIDRARVARGTKAEG